MIVGVEGRPGGEKQILRFILYLKFSIRIACAKVNGRVNEPTQMFFFRLPVDEKFMYKWTTRLRIKKRKKRRRQSR